MLLDWKGEILSEVQANSYPLPYISWTYLVWEFLASKLSLRRVQCAIIFDAPILSFRHLVIPFPNQSIRHPNFSFTNYNYTPKWSTFSTIHLLHKFLYKQIFLHITLQKFWILSSNIKTSSLSLFYAKSSNVIFFFCKSYNRQEEGREEEKEKKIWIRSKKKTKRKKERKGGKKEREE